MHKLFARPRLIITIVALITLFFAAQLPRVQFDNDLVSFVPKEHPTRIAFEAMDKLYQTDLTIVVGVQNPHGSILTTDGMELVHRLGEQFAAIEGVSEVTSLFTTDFIFGDEGGMRVAPILEEFHGTPIDVAQLRERLTAWPAYDGAFVSADLSSTQILVAVENALGAMDEQRVYFEVRAIVDAYGASGYRFYVAGEPALTTLVSSNILTDLALLIPLVVIAVIAALIIFFRRAAGVLLPLVTVLIATVWTVGLMALFGIKISVIASIIPVLMIAVGSAYGIHIVNHYFELGRTTPDAVFETLRTVGVPVLMAGVTTVAGFISLVTSEVAPMRSFGLFTAVGVAVALTVALTFVPALLLVLKPAAVRREHTGGAFLLTLYNYFGRRTSRILLLTLAIVLLSALGASRVVTDNELVAYFKEHTEVRQADRFLREQFLGTRSFNINVIGGNPADLTRPEVLHAMDELASFLRSRHPNAVSSVLSYADFIKRMNQVMHVGVPSPFVAGLSLTEPTLHTVPAYRTEPALGAEGAAPVAPAADTTNFGSFGGGFTGEGFTDSGFSADGFGTDGFSGGFTADGFTADGFSAEGFGSGAVSTSPGGTTAPGAGAAEPSTPRPDSSASAASGTAAPAATPRGIATNAAGSTAPAPAALVGPEVMAAYLERALALSPGQAIDGRELVRQLHRVTNYQGAAYYEIPTDPARYQAQSAAELQNLIAQYLLLYSGSLDSWSDDALEPTQARMSVMLRTTGNVETRQVVADVRRFVAERFPADISIEIAGVAIVETALTDLIVNAQLWSMALSLVLVFLIVAFTFKSAVAGLFGVVPLTLTLLVNFGVMGFFGIKLDISTAMVASIAIGIGIDYSIHFLSAYHRERRLTDDVQAVEVRVLSTTGKAIIFNALSVAAGFAVLMFSQFNPLMYMGILIALTMITSSLASLTVLPVLLDLVKPKFLQPTQEVER